MINDQISIKYDPKHDRLIIKNITAYMKFMVEKIEEFQKGKSVLFNLNTAPKPRMTIPVFGGILGDKLKRKRISDKDIRQNRKELLKKLESKK